MSFKNSFIMMMCNFTIKSSILVIIGKHVTWTTLNSKWASHDIYNEKNVFFHILIRRKKEQIFLLHARKKSPWERGKTCNTLAQTETFSESCQVLQTEVYNRKCLVTLIIAFGVVLPIMSKHLFKALVGLHKNLYKRSLLKFKLKYQRTMSCICAITSDKNKNIHKNFKIKSQVKFIPFDFENTCGP